MHSRSWCRRNLWALVVWVLCLPAFFVPRYLLKTGHNPPAGVYIAFMGGLAAFVTVREKMKRAEKAGWVILITLFIVAEVRNLYIADAEQVAKFGKISDALNATKHGLDATAAGINKAIDNSQVQFQATMSQFAAQNNTLGKLQAEDRLLAEKVSDSPVSSMPTKTLVEETRAVAQQMRAYLYSYQDTDMIRSIMARDQLRERESKMIPKEMEEWEEAEKIRRADLRTEYETGAKEIIATANRLRAEMVKRLIPSNRSAEDTTRAAWFQNPTSDNTLSWLYKLNENADYLDNLANRVPSVR